MQPTAAQILQEVAQKAYSTAMDPATAPQLLPQLLGVAARAASLAARAPDLSREGTQGDEVSGHPELPPLTTRIAGPPWDPFRDLPEEEQQRLNDILCARRICWLQDQEHELKCALGNPHLVAQVRDELIAARHVAASQ